MAYSTANPPELLVQGIGGTNKTFRYNTTDAAATLDASGYITDAKARGLVAGDLVIAADTDASPVIVTTHRVVAINTDGSGDLSNGDTTVTGTNSD